MSLFLLCDFDIYWLYFGDSILLDYQIKIVYLS